MPIDPLAVAARIKEARDAAGMTQAEMADLLHVQQRTYQNYESQSRKLVRVPYRLIDKIADATETTSEWLLHGTKVEAQPERLERIEQAVNLILDALGITPSGAAEAAEEAARATETRRGSSSGTQGASRKRRTQGG